MASPTDRSITSLFLPGVKDHEILSMIVLRLDGGGADIEAFGLVFVVPRPDGDGS